MPKYGAEAHEEGDVAVMISKATPEALDLRPIWELTGGALPSCLIL
jgi:hypothetical protein